LYDEHVVHFVGQRALEVTCRSEKILIFCERLEILDGFVLGIVRSGLRDVAEGYTYVFEDGGVGLGRREVEAVDGDVDGWRVEGDGQGFGFWRHGCVGVRFWEVSMCRRQDNGASSR
jgi:hypothetical protein